MFLNEVKLFPEARSSNSDTGNKKTQQSLHSSYRPQGTTISKGEDQSVQDNIPSTKPRSRHLTDPQLTFLNARYDSQ